MKTAAHLVLVATFLTVAAPARAGQASSKPDLGVASLEELLNIEITSASRREQAVEDTPAAAYVITQEDIRRSGIRLLPELFRLVPGMQVSRIGASEWAVSVRGFNTRYANKVLVLVDGRSIYNRAFTGVFWSSQEMMLDDIDRIEVIRGPGGAVWGADAVNGVINIITKSSEATQGTLVRAGAGTFDGPQAAIRYGGHIGNASYRVFTQWSNHQPTRVADPDASAGDGWSNSTTGIRVDWTTGASAFLLKGTVIDSNTQDLTTGRTGTSAIGAFNAPADAWHNALLGRWTYTTGGGTLQVQSFVNHNVTGPGGADADNRNSETLADLDVQFHRLRGRHDVVVGGGYRYASEFNVPSGQLTVVPASSTGTIANLFAQDEVTLTAHVRATLGSKFEHDSGSGWDMQPTARIIWDVGPSGQHLWASVSHALRTPAPYDTSLQISAPLPPVNGVPAQLSVSGNPDYPTERLDDVEMGYRFSLGRYASIDATAFNGHYDRLPSLHPLPAQLVPLPTPVLMIRQQFGNAMNADARGLEVLCRMRPMGSLALEASYSRLDITRTIDAGSGDTPNPNFTDNSPTNQWQLRATASPAANLEVSAALFYVGVIEALEVPAYTRADIGAEWKVSRHMSVFLTGQNLLRASHQEAVQNSLGITRVPRSGSLQAAWRF